MKVRLVMAAIAAISSVTCFGGLFDNALKAVSDTAKAVTASPAETREEAERARLKAVQEESARKEEERRKQVEKEQRERDETARAEREAKRKEREAERRRAEETAQAERKAREEQREKQRKEKEEEYRRYKEERERARKAQEEQREKERIAKEQKEKDEEWRKCRERTALAFVSAQRGNTGSVYVHAALKEAFDGCVQYATNSEIKTHVPIYKEITSGTTFGWVMDNGYLPDGANVRVVPFKIPGPNYQGCLAYVGNGVGLCCAISKTEEIVHGGISEGFVEEPLVEVFGMCKEFPKSATIKEVVDAIQKKYQSLKVNESQEDDEFLCMDFVGFSKKVSRRKIQFENGDLQGSCVGEEVQFNKVDWNSDAAAMWICGGVSEYLRKENSFKHAEFEKASGECNAAVRAEVKSGKRQKDIASFKVKFGNGNGGAEYEGELAYIMLETAKRTLKERAFWNKKDIERVKNELIAASAQMEAQLGQAASAGTLAKGPVLMVYDKNAVSALVDAEKKKDDTRKAEAQKKKEAEKAAALDF